MGLVLFIQLPWGGCCIRFTLGVETKNILWFTEIYHKSEKWTGNSVAWSHYYKYRDRRTSDKNRNVLIFWLGVMHHQHPHDPPWMGVLLFTSTRYPHNQSLALVIVLRTSMRQGASIPPATLYTVGTIVWCCTTLVCSGRDSSPWPTDLKADTLLRDQWFLQHSYVGFGNPGNTAVAVPILHFFSEYSATATRELHTAGMALCLPLPHKVQSGQSCLVFLAQTARRTKHLGEQRQRLPNPELPTALHFLH